MVSLLHRVDRGGDRRRCASKFGVELFRRKFTVLMTHSDLAQEVGLEHRIPFGKESRIGEPKRTETQDSVPRHGWRHTKHKRVSIAQFVCFIPFEVELGKIGRNRIHLRFTNGNTGSLI